MLLGYLALPQLSAFCVRFAISVAVWHSVSTTCQYNCNQSYSYLVFNYSHFVYDIFIHFWCCVVTRKPDDGTSCNGEWGFVHHQDGTGPGHCPSKGAPGCQNVASCMSDMYIILHHFCLRYHIIIYIYIILYIYILQYIIYINITLLLFLLLLLTLLLLQLLFIIVIVFSDIRYPTLVNKPSFLATHYR